MPEGKDGASGRSPKVYTVKDVARLLKFDRGKIYRMNNTGDLPKPLPLGKSLRWNGWEIDEWIDKGCPPPKRKRNKTTAYTGE